MAARPLAIDSGDVFDDLRVIRFAGHLGRHYAYLCEHIPSGRRKVYRGSDLVRGDATGLHLHPNLPTEEERLARVRAGFRRGESITVIARKIGMSPAALRKWLKHRGIDTSIRWIAKRGSRLDPHRDAILRHYRQGETINALANRYGVTWAAMRKWLRSRHDSNRALNEFVKPAIAKALRSAGIRTLGELKNSLRLGEVGAIRGIGPKRESQLARLVQEVL